MGLPRFFKLNTTSKSERSSSTVQLDLPSPKFAGQQPYTAVTPISPASSYSHEDYFPSTETQNHSFSWSSSSSTSQKSSTASICDKVGLNKGLRVSEGITSYRQTLRVLAYVDARPVVKIDEETATPNPITKEPFYIELDAGADVEATAAEVERALGVSGKFSAGCYKVSKYGDPSSVSLTPTLTRPDANLFRSPFLNKPSSKPLLTPSCTVKKSTSSPTFLLGVSMTRNSFTLL